MTKKYSPNKCVFCFNILDNVDICFETVETSVELTPDYVKYAYERRFDPSISENDLRCMSRQPIRPYDPGSGQFDLDPETGIPVAWNESRENGWTLKSKRRLCGFCHKPLPINFGKQPNITIGLCGNTASGKTVYMLSLIHDLNRVPNMSAVPDPIFFSELDTDYKSMYYAMYSGTAEGYELPFATSPLEILSPLVINCTYVSMGRAVNFMVTIFDMAGEGIKDQAYMAKQGVYLENTVGVIFLKNPDYFPGMRMAAEALEEHTYLSMLMETISAHPDGSRARVAITLTKADLLLDRYTSDAEFAKIAEMFEGDPVTSHPDGFDTGKAMRYNRRLYKMYNWENTRDSVICTWYSKLRPNEHAPAKKPGFFKRLFGGGRDEGQDEGNIRQWVMLFAASPLGRNVYFNDDNLLAIAPSGMLNVDPLLWLLYCCNIYPPRRIEDRN